MTSRQWTNQFSTLCQLPHREQAKWWLNGFWEQGASDHADEVWDTCHLWLEIENGFKVLYGSKMRDFTEGCDLDELQSHRALEALGSTMTVLELRKRLKALDIDNNKRMALSEYLLDRFKKTPQELVDAPQGNIDPVQLANAEKAFEDAGAALNKAQNDAQLASSALLESQLSAATAAKALDEAKAAAAAAAAALEEAHQKAVAANADKTNADAAAVEAEQKLEASTDAAAAAAAAKAEADRTAAEAAGLLKAQEDAEGLVRTAEAELQSAIDELVAQETARDTKIAELQAIVDSGVGVVKKGKASNEIEQIRSEDPLPIRTAKITQGAALKKVEKQRKIAEEATAAAAGVKKTADDAAQLAASKKEAADAAASAAAAAKEAADSTARAAAESKAAADAAEVESESAKTAADAAEARSTTAKQEADAKEAASAAAKAQADAAKAAAEVAVREAEELLEELKKGGSGTPHGVLYWMEKELAEKKKFMGRSGPVTPAMA